MVDIVDLKRYVATAKTHEVLEAVEEILGPQGHLVLREFLLELSANAETSDPTEPITIGIKKLVLEKLFCLFHLRRVSRAKPLVYPQQSLLVIVGGVLG